MRRFALALLALVTACLAEPLTAQMPEVAACMGAPTSLRFVIPSDTTDTLPLAIRRDDAFVAKDDRCLAVVTLGDGGRFVVKYHPCVTGQPWRQHATSYVTRTSAIERARRVPACPKAALVPSARSFSPRG